MKARRDDRIAVIVASAEGAPVRRPSTRSGKATLAAVDVSAIALGDVLVTPAPRGFWPLEVRGVRESAWGEDGDEPQHCLVVDVAVIPTDSSTAKLAGRRLAFAPEDLLRVRVSA